MRQFKLDEEWYGARSIPSQHMFHLEIAGFRLWLTNLPHECAICFSQGHYSNLEQSIVSEIVPYDPAQLPDKEVTKYRVGLGKERAEYEILPALADLPVVSRPSIPFQILDDDEIYVYISSPLYLRVTYGSDKKLLFDRGLYQPSETWYGQNTMSGQKCYASRTLAMLQLETKSILYNRAVTKIRVINRSGSTFRVERFLIPVPILELFQDKSGRFWTQEVTLERGKNNEIAVKEISSTPPPEALEIRKIHPARSNQNANFFGKTFGAMLS